MEPGETYVPEDELDFTEARREHLDKIAGEGKTIERVVPRSVATSRVLSGRWVDTMQADGSKKSRWTTRGFEQTLHGTENHVAGTPSLPHLKALLVDAARRGYKVALGDCSGAFYQAPLTEEAICLEPPPDAEIASSQVWEALCAFPGLKGAPKA